MLRDADGLLMKIKWFIKLCNNTVVTYVQDLEVVL